MLVEEGIPYFNRTWDHFSSHRQTPFERTSGHPMIARRGRVIYFASPIFRAYREYGNHVYKALMANALSMLMPDPLVQTNLPSAGEAMLLEQRAPDGGRRLVCHLLYYTAQRRAARIDIIEDAATLHDVELAVKAGQAPKRVYLAPQGQDLPFTVEGPLVRCRVPEMCGHQIVVIE
jgi:hypothetical protein